MKSRFNYKVPIVIASFILIAVLLIVTMQIDKAHRYEGPELEVKQSTPTLELKPVDGEVFLVNPVIAEWMNSDESAISMYNSFREAGRIDNPDPFTVAYSLKGLPYDVKVESQYVEVSENKDFSNAIKVSVDTKKRFAEIYNLYTNTTYYCRVTVNLSNGETLTAQGEYKTAVSPRLILVDGIRNVRDVGGYVNYEGKTIKQGMVYRGTELDGAISKKYTLTDAGVNTMVNELGIKTEIDLRGSEVTDVKHYLGEDTEHTYHSFLAYMDLFTEHGMNKTREIFQILAQPESYPVYFHCTYGADRTGTLAYLIQGILGLSEEQLHDEWELSVFFAGGAFDEDMAKFEAAIMEYRGDTIQEKIENFILDTGVTYEEIESIRNILLSE
ncbi:MAG: tyrosine-protein phosphatase [Ruminococcus sp.]|nr:tyrosine-protein phosphatase [Ruminococcus sp.]